MHLSCIENVSSKNVGFNFFKDGLSDQCFPVLQYIPGCKVFLHRVHALRVIISPPSCSFRHRVMATEQLTMLSRGHFSKQKLVPKRAHQVPSLPSLKEQGPQDTCWLRIKPSLVGKYKSNNGRAYERYQGYGVYCLVCPL